MENDSHILRVSLGSKKLGHAGTKTTLTWGEIADRFTTPTIDKGVTVQQYEAFSKSSKGFAKSEPGLIFAGFCENDIRHKDKVLFRSVVTLDADNLPDDELYLQLKEGRFDELEFACVAHTTRSHGPRHPKMRIFIPLSREIEDEDEFVAVSRLVAERIDPSMEAWDPVSFRYAQMMYMPSISEDQEFVARKMPGSICDPDMLLEEVEDWRDLSQLPRSESERAKIAAAVRKARAGGGNGRLTDPARKRGIVGTFCQAYDIEAAIAAFLPGIYIPSEGAGAAPDRWTYAEGSSVNGAIIFDGTHLYSHHATDPAGGQALNAFDLVRIHKFGHFDEGFDSANPCEMISHEAMVKLAENDPAVIAAGRAKQISPEMFDLEMC